MENPTWGAEAPAHGDPYMGCRGTCSWRPLYGVQMHLLMETPIWGADAPAHGDPGVQMHLLMETPIWGADAPAHGDPGGADAPAHGDPYMGCRCTCSWMQ